MISIWTRAKIFGQSMKWLWHYRGANPQSSRKGQVGPFWWFSLSKKKLLLFQWLYAFQAPSKIEKWLECCEVLRKHFQLSYFSLRTTKSSFWNIFTKISFSKMCYLVFPLIPIELQTQLSTNLCNHVVWIFLSCSNLILKKKLFDYIPSIYKKD